MYGTGASKRLEQHPPELAHRVIMMHSCEGRQSHSTTLRFASSVCRAIRHLHKEAASKLEVDRECGDEVEKLLNELQQLLVGISIMQVRGVLLI